MYIIDINFSKKYPNIEGLDELNELMIAEHKFMPTEVGFKTVLEGDVARKYNKIKKNLVAYSKIKKREEINKEACNLIKSGKFIPLNSLNPRNWDSQKNYKEIMTYDYYLFLCEECEYVVADKDKLTKEEFKIIIKFLK